jgi:fructose-bisphosphate aldolase class II
VTIARTADLVDDAHRAGRAVAAINVITLEHAEAIADAADDLATPVIMQISENAVRYHGDELTPLALAVHAIAERAAVPIALHLDHVVSPTLFERGLRSVFSSIMFDAGAQPYADNVEHTARAVREAHAAGLWLEAELGYVGGKPDAPRSAHLAGVRTDPAEADRFVGSTGVDALAVAVGSSHAMTERSARLDSGLIAELAARLAVPLVLHGSSGVPPDELRTAVAAGIAKVNVGTALNIAMTGAVRTTLGADPDLVDPRRYLAAGRTAMIEAVRDLLDTLPSPRPGGNPTASGVAGR